MPRSQFPPMIYRKMESFPRNRSFIRIIRQIPAARTAIIIFRREIICCSGVFSSHLMDELAQRLAADSVLLIRSSGMRTGIIRSWLAAVSSSGDGCFFSKLSVSRANRRSSSAPPAPVLALSLIHL